jgi:hypothetical protein
MSAAWVRRHRCHDRKADVGCQVEKAGHPVTPVQPPAKPRLQMVDFLDRQAAGGQPAVPPKRKRIPLYTLPKGGFGRLKPGVPDGATVGGGIGDEALSQDGGSVQPDLLRRNKDSVSSHEVTDRNHGQPIPPRQVRQRRQVVLGEAGAQLQRLGSGRDKGLLRAQAAPGRQARLAPGQPVMQRPGDGKEHRQAWVFQSFQPEALRQSAGQLGNRFERTVPHASYWTPTRTGDQAQIPLRLWHFTLASRATERVSPRTLTSSARDQEEYALTGFFYLKSGTLSDQRATGEKIMKLMRSVGNEGPGSEWMAFKADPKTWLSGAGYEYRVLGAAAASPFPESLTLKPVYDTETLMHVRIPWKGCLDGFSAEQIMDEQGYGQGAAKLPVFMARYFMRRCR